MDFGITIEIDLEADKMSASIQKTSDLLSDYFKAKDYGDGVQSLYIGLICLRPMKEFASFTKERKPKYVASQKVRLLDGSNREIKNTFSYDVKFDENTYKLFIQASEKEALNLLINLLIESLINLDALPKKVKNFDVGLFKTDMVRKLIEIRE